MNHDPLVKAFDRLLRSRPGEPVVVSASRSCTIESLDDMARAAARRLEAAGSTPGSIVALLAANGPGFLAGLLALRRAGFVALLVDRRTPRQERRRIAAHLHASAVVRCARPWPRGDDDWIVEVENRENWGHSPLREEGWEIASSRVSNGECPQFSRDAAVIKLSSGSTGTPHGVLTPMDSLLADDEALTATMGIGQDDRLLATVPFSHSYGLSSLVIPALARGIVLAVPDEDAPFSPLETARLQDATVFPSVPAYLGALLRLSDPPPLPESLRRIITAGAPIQPETAERFRETFGRSVHVFYGSSETGGICYDQEGSAAVRGTVGTPIEGVGVRIEQVEGADMQGGRVVVESPAVTWGYWPESDDRLRDGRFVTDDLAAWDRGELRLVGRLSDTINVKGRKVNPREVEDVLTGLDGVLEVHVMGVPTPGGTDQIVRAVVACRAGDLTAEPVLAWCRQHLTDYKVPRSVVLVDEIPRTDRGKLDRAALAALGSGARSLDRRDG